MGSLGQSLNASLAELLEGSSFTEVCLSYYNLFEVPIRVFDKEGNLLAEVVQTHGPCQYLNRFEAGRKICTATRLEVKKPETDSTELSFTDCICGLRYTQAPIIFQTEVAGKIVLGPYLPTELKQLSESLTGVDERFDVPFLKEELGKLRKVSQTAIRRIAAAIASVVDVILFSSQKAHVTTQMHIAAVRESYRELSDKNRELEEMNEQMQEFERLKSNFLSTVSHELRTPLTSIIGYSDMLVEGIAGDLGDEQKQFVKTIKAKGDELLKLISSILDFSRIETGHLDLHWMECNPSDVVEAAVDANQDLADRRGARLVLDVAEGLPTVSLDPERVRTAVDHLVQNAVKFSSPGSVVKVTVQIISPEEEDVPEDGLGFVLMSKPDMLEIAVEDFGIGISEGDQAQIFSPFTQLDNSSTREHGGSGLGLAVVKYYISAHGGEVRVSSRVDEGSKFSIWIPLVDRD